ncbi:MAG: SDR family oxidoreductase [Anaerolineales bacterium]
MTNPSQKRNVVLITGASSGIGKACATHLAHQGYHVYGTSRQRRPPNALFTMLQMDVREDDDVDAGVQEILSREERLDVVINNAGFGYSGAVEDTSVEEARTMFETNLFGALRVCHAVLPTMRAQGQGTLINIGSIGGIIGLPYQGLYCAAKFALHGMTEALRMEIKGLGLDINVVLVAPGDIRTDFPAHRQTTRATEQEGGSAYAAQHQRARAAFEEDELNGAEPSRVAQIVGKIIQDPSPKARYLVGGFDEKLAAHLKPLLPPRLFDWIVMREYEIG